MSDTDKIARLEAALRIYADPAHWMHGHITTGHGSGGEGWMWRGPRDAFDWGVPTKGPEYAQDALRGN